MNSYKWIVLFLILFVLVGCGEEAEPTPTATVQAASAATEKQPAATSTIAPTEVSPPSETPTPGALSDASVSAASGFNSPLSTQSVKSAPGAEALPSTAASDIQNCTIPLHLDLMGYPDAKNLPDVMGCPVAEASTDPVAINEYGEGPDYDRFMLWFGAESQIYVLFADKTWLAYTDTWREGQPEIACNPTGGPKTSPPLPRRGFGKLWCTVDSVREAMGTIEREERLCQHSVTQRFDNGRLLACFEDATIRYFRVMDDGKWDLLIVR